MRRSLFACCTLVILAACGDDEEYSPPRPLTADEKALVQASNAFGYDFFAQVVSDTAEENVFVSPLSVSMALGMTYNGARGETATGMATALALGDMDLAAANASSRSLIELLTTMDAEVVLEIANSIWYQRGLTVLAEFVDACVTYFDATVSAFDSVDGAAAINNWVNEKTHGKIKTIVDGIDAAATMYLINAVYFKGDWTTQFDKDNTHADTFHGASGDVSIDMMSTASDQKIAYMNNDRFQAARLPYGHQNFAMTILLPRDGTTVDDVVASLDETSWAETQAAMSKQEIPLYMPRFELTYEADLKQALTALGMQEAFVPGTADFSGINGALDLYIDRVKHKTYIKVNEVGTEAAAVTSVEMRVTGIAETMRIDRPFVVVIHDTHSQALLFMGRILDL